MMGRRLGLVSLCDSCLPSPGGRAEMPVLFGFLIAVPGGLAVLAGLAAITASAACAATAWRPGHGPDAAGP